MTYQFETKIFQTLDDSKVLPFNKLHTELFYPDINENTQTTELVNEIAVKVALTLLNALCDPKKATSDYLSRKNGRFSWGKTSEEEHAACISKMTTNNPAKSPFAALTRQLQYFGRVLGTHASAVGHA